MENIEQFLKSSKEKMHELNLRMGWLQDHNFQEEKRILQIKYGAFRQMHDELERFCWDNKIISR